MPQFGAHAFIWAGEWTPEGVEKVISGASEARLDFVEIPLLHPESVDVSGTRELLELYGIGCTCSLGLPRSAHLPFAPDAAERFLQKAVDVTAALGSDALSGAIYTHLGTLTRKPPTEDELATVAWVIKSVARYAAERDVSPGIEAINRYETYLINLASQADEMLSRIDEANVFIHLDTYHMNIEEKGFYDPIVATGPRMRYIHLSDSDRGTPGTGNVHWDDVFRGLKAIEYDGRLVMESFAAVNEDIIGATALWRNVVGDPQALIVGGLTFLCDKAAKHHLPEGSADPPRVG
jgi:D-psicose/D-tagatose/L-ribulose 3-epimerase